MVQRLNKNIFLGIAILAAVIFVTSLVSMYLKSSQSPLMCEADKINGTLCPLESFLFDLLPLIVAASIVVGAGVYYFMSQKMEIKDENLKKNTGVILNLLNQDEKKVIEKILAGKGQVLQAEITRLPDMSKVKSHRIVKRLFQRGVIRIEKYGKTNIVKLNDEIKDGLL